MTSLPVNEIFDTLQGEGAFTGMPSTFVRLQGCDVGCPWCDTKHTWSVLSDDLVGMPTLMGKTSDGPSYAVLAPSHLATTVIGMAPSHVVITGGEPAAYDLEELTGLLCDAGKTVQIETSGTYPLRVDMRTWVTVSPKVGMPGGRTVLDEVVGRAHEIKMPVGKLEDIERLDQVLTRLIELGGGPPQVWLQPLSTSEKATRLCIDVATARGWRVSIQTHKYAGLR